MGHAFAGAASQKAHDFTVNPVMPSICQILPELTVSTLLSSLEKSVSPLENKLHQDWLTTFLMLWFSNSLNFIYCKTTWTTGKQLNVCLNLRIFNPFCSFLLSIHYPYISTGWSGGLWECYEPGRQFLSLMTHPSIVTWPVCQHRYLPNVQMQSKGCSVVRGRESL